MTDLSETDFRTRFLRLEAKVLPGDAPGVNTLVFDSGLNIDASTTIALEEAGVHLLDTGTLNFAGDAVDVTDDGDGTATVTIAGGEDIDTHTDVSEDGVTVVPDVGDLNFTGSGVDVADDGDGTVTATITDTDTNTDTNTHPDVSEDGALLVGDVGDINFTGSGVDVTDDGDGTVTATITDTDTNTDTDTQTATHTFPVTEIPDTEAAVMRVFCPAIQDMLIFRGGVQDDTGAVPAGLDLRVYNETDANEVRLITSKYANSTGNTISGGAAGKDILFELRNNTGAVVNATGWVEYALR